MPLPAGLTLDEVNPVLEKLQGNEFHRLWGSDVVSSFPDDGSRPSAPRWFPPVGGLRFAMFTVPPDSAAPPDGVTPEEIAAEVEAKLPGLGDHMEPDAPGMHTTDTVDVIWGRLHPSVII